MSKTVAEPEAAVEHELPCRQGCPVYDPSLDPGSSQWQPKKYFNARPQVTVVTGRDADNPLITEITLSINGYGMKVPTDSDVVLPIDFADLLEQSGMGRKLSSRRYA